jgi:murein DD-endopeptidase MepM/ murein hydrolase activator NlpD
LEEKRKDWIYKGKRGLYRSFAVLMLLALLAGTQVRATESGEKVISTGGADSGSSGSNGTGDTGDSSGSSGTSGSSGGGTGSTSRPKIDTTALEQKRKELLDKIDDIKDSIDSVKDRISELEQSKSNLQSYINKLDAEAKSLGEEIRKVEEEISQKKADIEETQKELEAAQETADQQYESMKVRIQYMYENSGFSYLEMILTARSISDILNKVDYIAQINEYDRNMLDEYIAIKESIAQYKVQLEQEEEELEALSEGLQEQKEAVDLLISAKTKEIANYQSLINEASADAADYEKQLLAQEKALEQAEAAIAAAAAANANAGDGDGGASGLIWPCPASRRITSGFGPRNAPVAGASTYHKGIDIGAGTGSAIVAASSGVVTTAAYSGSAGNYIVISHGGGLSTVYMHCSALYVSSGQQVNKGDTIAAVGSTGYSTAPHLHFGVIKNGTYVNPLGYVG